MEYENKTDLNGISETMFQTLYTRAKKSEKPKHKIFDARMEEGLADAKAGRGLELDEAFDQLVNGKTD